VRDLRAALLVDDDVVGLQVAVDDPAAVGEAGGAEHLDGEVDRTRRVERGLLLDDGLERAAVEELHRDVVRALPLAAVVDGDDVLVVEARRAARLAPEALDELGVLGEAAVQDLERDPPPELQVLGAVDVGHPARADAIEHAVAAIDDRLGGEALGHLRSSCMTFLAIGAATSPPVPAEHSIVTAIATFGSCSGANAMNQTWLGQPWPTSAVPVLPPT